jgi:hypothetical protein
VNLRSLSASSASVKNYLVTTSRCPFLERGNSK